MPFLRSLRKPLAGTFAFAALAATAHAADVTITDAKIEGGKLVITGTTASPNTWVRLDDRIGADFNVKSGPAGAFSIGVVYHPGDCIVELQKLVSPTTLGAATAALVADCGPVGITPRGAWGAKVLYSTNDLVTYDGSSWRAKRDNVGREPGAAADWELLAAKGEAADAAGTESETAGGGAGPVGPMVAPTGPAGGDLAGNYPNPLIRFQAVTTAKIANSAVTQNKIAPNAVTTAKIANFAVTLDKIGLNAVNTGKIVDNSVRSIDVRDDTLFQGGLGAQDLAPDSVGQSEIQTDGVAATEIADNSIDSGEIVNDSLFANDLAASSVRASELGTITRRSATNAAIAAGTVGSATAACLAGERVIAGGNDASFDINVVASRDSGNGWQVFGRNIAGANRSITAHAYCLQAS